MKAMNIWQKLSIRRSSERTDRKNEYLLFGGFIGVFLISLLLAIFFGSTKTSVIQAISALFSGDFESTAFRIIFYVRMPRVAAAVLAGSALAVSGVIIQAVLNNVMAAPNIIGVNSGAGLTAILLIAVMPSAIRFLPLAAFVGAMAASLCIYVISSLTGAGKITITLVGIAVSNILTAGISTVKTLFPDSIYDSNTFMVGGVSGMEYGKLSPAWWMIVCTIAAACMLSKHIDILSLGATSAQSLGINVGRMRFLMLLVASLLAGCAVSFAGLLGFVGLVVPHIARKFVGNKHGLLIPLSAIGGAALVLICDLIGRVIFAPYEIPVGIILSFVGGPFFIVLIAMRRKGGKEYD